MLYRTGRDPETWGHTVHTPRQQVIRCTQVNCTCQCFRPHRLNIRSCDHCKHGWVAHAVSKLCVCWGQVEVVRSDTVCDLSALVLMNTQALPVRMKILLDRLFSVLTHTNVLQILHTHGWTLHDYVRGYMLQDPLGNVLDRWVIMTLEDELLTLKQFLRFGETKSIVELMVAREEFGENFKPTKNVSDRSASGESPKTQTMSARDPKQPVGHRLDQNTWRKLEILQPDQSRDTPSVLLQQFRKLPFRDGRCPGNGEPTKILMMSPRGTETHFTGDRRQERKNRGVRDCPRKARVSCVSCGKTFYDKGTLKIHHNAVHLKIKHRCTVQGCTMVFSSLRSRNRHSANPNPRLHAPALQNPPPTDRQAPPLSSASPRYVQDASNPSLPANVDALNVPAPRGGAPALATPKKKPRKSSTPLKIQRCRDDAADDGDGAKFRTSEQRRTNLLR